MDGIWQDVKHAVRSLRRSPGFTIVAVTALALGIGANSAIFGVVHAVLLRPLPLPEPQRIVTLISTNQGRGIRDGGVSFGDYYEDWRQQHDVFEYLALWRPQNLDLTGGDQPERVAGLAVTGEFFDVLGARAAIGQTFGTPAEADGERPAVLARGAWQRLFGGRDDAIGRTVHLSGVPHIVVGVLPDELVWPRDTDVFVPLRLRPNEDTLRRDNFIFRSVARLRAGATIEQARARAASLARAIEEQLPASRKGWSYDVVGLQEYTVGADFRNALVVLMSAVGLVLLIACANVANLLLARGADRRRELAVRSALGATRTRLARSMLAESTVVAATGGLAGLTLGYWLSRLLAAVAPGSMALVEPMHLNAEVAAFTAGVSLLAVFGFGLLPALQTSLVSPGDALKDAPRGSTSGRAGRLRDAIVVVEVALAVLLLVGAGLLIRSLVALGRVDPGVDVRNVLAARVIVPSARYPESARRATFYRELLTKIRTLPGVESAAVSSRLPAGGPGAGLGRVFLVEGQAEPPASSDYPAQWTVVSPEYFQTLGLRVVRGRGLREQDTAESTPVIVISERMANQMFPNGDPIGRRIRSWRDENRLREIVGVVSDVRYFSLDDRPRSAVYVPHAQDSWGTMVLAVKTAGDPLGVVPGVRREVGALDPMLALGTIGTLAAFSADSVDVNRFLARLLAAFAALALTLATIGVYGVMAFAVSRRAPEIGVRLALGATRRDIAVMVLRRGLLLAGAGLAIGLPGAAALARTLGAAIPEVGPLDPVAFALSPVILGVVALVACAVPALRAARLDPVGVLRT